MNHFLRTRYQRNFFFFFLFLTAIIILVYFLKDIFAPFFISLLAAYILNPIYLKLQSKGLSKNISMFVIFGSISMLFTIFMLLLIPKLYQQLENSGDLLLGETLTKDHDHNGSLASPNGVFDMGPVFLKTENNGDLELKRADTKTYRFYFDANNNDVKDSDEELFKLGDEGVYVKWTDEFKDTNDNGIWDGNIINKLYERAKSLIDDNFKESEVLQYKILLKNKLKEIINNIKSNFQSTEESFGLTDKKQTQEKNSLSILLGYVQSGLLYLIWLLLIPVYTFFLLRGLGQIKTEGKKYIPAIYREHVLHVLSRIDSSISAFFMGRIVASLIISVVTTFCFFMSNVDFALIFGVMLGFAVMMPIINIIFVIPPAILVYANHGAGAEIIWVLLAYLFAVILDTILTPALIGKKANLHIVTVILAFFVFGKILGVIGVVLAIPFAATTKILFEEYALPRLMDLAQNDGEIKNVNKP